MARWWEKYKVSVPEGERGPWKIERFTIDAKRDPSVFMFNLRAGSRAVPDGEYTRLVHNRRGVVMSDTPAEVNDHLEAMHRLERPEARRVLIHGLGLGMVLQHALRQPHVERVDVVEIDQDVIDLVGPHYREMVLQERERRDLLERTAGEVARPLTLVIHLGDALTFRFPKEVQFSICWHDVWDAICGDNHGGMSRLRRRYGRRCGWQGCWGEREVRRMVRRDREWEATWGAPVRAMERRAAEAIRG